MKNYQEKSARTDSEHKELILTAEQSALLNAAVGLVGEAGEILDTVKKIIWQGHPLNPDQLAEEGGDTLWYLAKLARVIKVDLQDIADGNIEKLEKRYPNGFSSSQSIKRK